MNLKNKILLTLIAIVFAICLFNTNCFATDYSFTLPGGTPGTVTIPDWIEENGYNYMFYCLKYTNSDNNEILKIDLYVSKGTIKLGNKNASTYIFGDGTSQISCISSSSGSYSSDSATQKLINERISNMEEKEVTSWKDSDILAYQYSYANFKENAVVFCNSDILDNTTGEVVFQAPVKETTILAPVVEKQEMKPLEEILKLIPIVMIVLVSYLALRKALKMLSTFLRNS